MASPLLSLRNVDGSEITSIDFGTVNAGEVSGTVEIRVWNDYGGANGSDEAQNVGIKVLDANGQEQGDLVEEAWLEYRVGKNDDTAYPALVENDWKPLGKGFYAELGSIQSNTYRTLFLRLRVPPGEASGTIDFMLSPFYKPAYAVVDDVLYKLVDDGIVSGAGDEDFQICDGFWVSADGTDTVAVGSGEFYSFGVKKKSGGGLIALDQTDGDGVALDGVDRNVYGAVIYLNRDGSVGVVKGAGQASEPVYPGVPADALEIARVNVAYQEGGASVITQQDVSWSVTGTDFMLLPLTDGGAYTGELFVGAGRCIVGGRYFEISSSIVFSLATGETRIGITEDGIIAVNPGGVEYINICHVNWDGTTLTIKDLRHFIDSDGLWCEAGEALDKGNVVSFSSPGVVQKSSVAGDKAFVGIAEHSVIAAGDTVFVRRSGVVMALVYDSCSPGDLLVVSSTVGILSVNNSADASQIVGIALESVGAGETSLIAVLLK